MQGCQGDLGQVTSLLCASAATNFYSVPTVCQGPAYYLHYVQYPQYAEVDRQHTLPFTDGETEVQASWEGPLMAGEQMS